MLSILRLVSAVKGPLNILATVGSPSISEMQRIGVRRVSLGSGPSRVALGAFQRFVRDHGLVIHEPPLKLPPVKVVQIWHERFDRDPLNVWLRSAIHDMVSGA